LNFEYFFVVFAKNFTMLIFYFGGKWDYRQFLRENLRGRGSKEKSKRKNRAIKGRKKPLKS